MTKLARTAALCLASLVLLPWCARAQAVPAALGPRFFQGFTLPDTAGTLHYSLNAAERLIYGYNGTNASVSQTALSVDLGYLSASESSPLSVLYSGGYLINTSQPSAFFDSIDIAKTIQKKHWNLAARDSFRYLPESPTGGFAGLSGLGNPGFPPVGSVGGSGQGIVTQFATQVDNIANGIFGIPVTGDTAFNLTGSYSILRFPSASSAIENDAYSWGGGVAHRIDARNAVTADYTYRKFTFLSLNRSFVLQDVTAGYTRQWTRKVTTHLAAGPQYTSGSLLPANSSTLSYTANAQITYGGARSTLSADYLHGTGSGSGVTYGAQNDSARVTAAHQLSRQMTGSVTLGYARSQGLAFLASKSFNASSLIGTAQLNRELTPSINAFASYTAANQSISGFASGVAPLNGLSQVIGFGVSFSPRPIRVGKH